jgi:hypothetical protein
MRRVVVSKKLVDELSVILEEEFEIKLDPSRLNKLANFLVSYFQILLQINKSK